MRFFIPVVRQPLISGSSEERGREREVLRRKNRVSVYRTVPNERTLCEHTVFTYAASAPRFTPSSLRSFNLPWKNMCHLWLSNVFSSSSSLPLLPSICPIREINRGRDFRELSPRSFPLSMQRSRRDDRQIVFPSKYWLRRINFRIWSINLRDFRRGERSLTCWTCLNTRRFSNRSVSFGNNILQSLTIELMAIRFALN